MGKDDTVVVDTNLVPPELRIDEKESELHRLDSLSLLLYTYLLILTVLTIWLFKYRRIRYLHATGVAVFFGFIVGALIRYGMNDVGNEVTKLRVKPYGGGVRNATVNGPPDFLLLEVEGIRSKSARTSLMNRTLSYAFLGEVKDVEEINEIDQKATFDPELFFNLILPPIIFHAGYSMKKRFFFRNIGSILTFAFLGTVISTFAVGGVMHGVTRMFDHLHKITFLDSLHFGALISATDPVTVLAIFNDLHVDVNLYAIVFGESVLNDAVAIVMTRTFEDYEESSKITAPEDQMSTQAVVLWAVLDFLMIFGASFFVGSIMACFTALLTKHTHIKQHPILETSLFVLMSYSTFLLAEVLNLTGIVSVLFCGICQAHYTYNNLSVESKVTTKKFFELLNFLAENFIFSYIGVSMFTFPKHRFDIAFIAGSFLAIIIGRALNIYVLSFFLNLGRKTKISYSLQHMMFFSGLRGAIAFALSIRNTLSEARQMILTTTLIIVIVTVAVCGGSTLSLLTWLGIPLGVNDDENAPLSSPTHRYDSVTVGANANADAEAAEIQTVPGTVPGKSLLAQVWSGFDTKYMKPFLTHSNPTLMETLPDCCLPIARVLTSQEQLSKHPAMRGFSTEEFVNSVEDSSSAAGEAAAAAEGNGTAATPQKDHIAKQLPSHI